MELMEYLQEDVRQRVKATGSSGKSCYFYPMSKTRIKEFRISKIIIDKLLGSIKLEKIGYRVNDLRYLADKAVRRSRLRNRAGGRSR